MLDELLSKLRSIYNYTRGAAATSCQDSRDALVEIHDNLELLIDEIYIYASTEGERHDK